MKVSKLGLVTACLLGSFLLSNSLALAADSTNQTAKPKTTAKAPATAQARLDKLAGKLKLTPEQRDKLLPIFQEEIDKRKEVTQRRQAERDKIREDFLAKIKASGALTDTQYAQWLALQTPAKKTAAKPVKPKKPNQTNNQ
jgi:hypothetical protein